MPIVFIIYKEAATRPSKILSKPVTLLVYKKWILIKKTFMVFSSENNRQRILLQWLKITMSILQINFLSLHIIKCTSDSQYTEIELFIS